jgi:hypothetical protein
MSLEIAKELIARQPPEARAIVRLHVRLKDGVCVLSETNPGVFSSLPGWTFHEGKIFENGALRTRIHLPIEANATGD